MERIKIEIKRLGRVKDSVIEIAPLMVFSGESGMGKSYLALLAHYFFDMLIVSEQTHRLALFFEEHHYSYKDMVNDFLGQGVALAISKADIVSWMEKDAISYLRFMLNSDSLEGEIKITLPSIVPDEIQMSFQEDVSGLVNREDKGVILSIGDIGYRVSRSTINVITPFAFVLSAYLTKCLFGNVNAIHSTFNMPPSRGPVLSENVVANSGMYKDFIADVTELSNVQSSPKLVSTSLLEELYTVMEGEVKKLDNKFIYLTNGVSMPISAAASSIREIAPLQILATRWNMGQTALLIEEPEAHLHPNKQRMMADVVGCIHQTGSYVHLTTHSDYFLRRMNELLLFQRYADNHSKEETAALSEKTGIKLTFSIREKDVVGYLVQRQGDGTSKVVKQELEDGVPFSSFSDAVKESIRVNDLLEEALGL